MEVFDQNWLYAIKCLALIFVVAPGIMMCGAGIICAGIFGIQRLATTLRLRKMALPRCSKCRFYGMVQCPMYGRNCPDDFCSRAERWDSQ